MRKRTIITVLLLVLCAYAVGADIENSGIDGGAALYGDGPYGVVKVIDGDTIDIVRLDPMTLRQSSSNPTRVRLLNVDTPEMDTPQGPFAMRWLQERLAGVTVYLTYQKPRQPEYDKYKRLLAYVHVVENVNVSLVRRGLSDYYTKYGESRYDSEFRAAAGESTQASGPKVTYGANNPRLYHFGKCVYWPTEPAATSLNDALRRGLKPCPNCDAVKLSGQRQSR